MSNIINNIEDIEKLEGLTDKIKRQLIQCFKFLGYKGIEKVLTFPNFIVSGGDSSQRGIVIQVILDIFNHYELMEGKDVLQTYPCDFTIINELKKEYKENLRQDKEKYKRQCDPDYDFKMKILEIDLHYNEPFNESKYLTPYHQSINKPMHSSERVQKKVKNLLGKCMSERKILCINDAQELLKLDGYIIDDHNVTINIKYSVINQINNYLREECNYVILSGDKTLANFKISNFCYNYGNFLWHFKIDDVELI